MKTVIDCNVLISAGISAGNCRNVIKKAIANCDNFMSELILFEYKEVISREKFLNYKDRLISLMEAICQNSSYVKINNYLINYTLPDKQDEVYLKTALKAKADYLITGNLKDFPKKIYDTTKIVSPVEFLKLLRLC